MTVEELKAELEKITLELNSSDFSNIDPNMTKKLEKLAVIAEELGMKKGRQLIKNLLGFLHTIGDGKTRIMESGNLRLTALDFYLKKIAGSGNIEDI